MVTYMLSESTGGWVLYDDEGMRLRFGAVGSPSSNRDGEVRRTGATHRTHQFQRNTVHPRGFRGTDRPAIHRTVGRLLADRMVVPSHGHEGPGQTDRGVHDIQLRSGVPMNPDPSTPIDPDTPLRFDHLLHLLTSFALTTWQPTSISFTRVGFTHTPKTGQEPDESNQPTSA